MHVLDLCTHLSFPAALYVLHTCIQGPRSWYVLQMFAWNKYLFSAVNSTLRNFFERFSVCDICCGKGFFCENEQSTILKHQSVVYWKQNGYWQLRKHRDLLRKCLYLFPIHSLFRLQWTRLKNHSGLSKSILPTKHCCKNFELH